MTATTEQIDAIIDAEYAFLRAYFQECGTDLIDADTLKARLGWLARGAWERRQKAERESGS